MAIRSEWAAVAVLTVALHGCGSAEEPTVGGVPMVRAEAESRDPGGSNRAPVVEDIVLSPERVLEGRPVEARVDAFDPDGDSIRLDYTWRVDGEVRAEGRHDRFTPSGVRKGSRVEVEVVASDPSGAKASAHASAEIGNRRPQLVGVELRPTGQVRPGAELVAQLEAADPDGDRLVPEFVWEVNGRRQPPTDEARFDTNGLQRGDRLRVHARVGDGEAWSASRNSRIIELANSPPEISPLGEIEAQDGAFRHRLEVRDPDGDRNLRFRLVSGPEGMSLDPVRGILHWRPREDQTGNHPVEVAVEDDYGASSSLRFALTVDFEAGPEPSAPPASMAD